MARYKLEDIFDLQMGKTPSRNNSEYWNTCDNKWISIGDLTQAGKYITDTKEYLSDVAVEESGIKIIPANTVVMSFKLSIGKTAITSEDMYSNEAIMAFHDKHVVDIMPEYIYYMFKYKNWDEGTNKAVMGKTLNKATLSKAEIDVCPLEKQKEIVELLDRVSAIVDGRNKELETLDNLIKARFVELFGTLNDNENGFDVVTIEDVCSLIKDGTHQTPQYTEDREEGYKFLSSKDVMSQKIDWTDIKYIPAELHEKLYATIKPQRNDILMSKNGVNYGVAAVNDTDEVFDIYVSLALLRPKEMIEPVFFWCVINNPETKRQFDSSIKGIGVPNLHLGEIKKTKIFLPPMELQKKFVNFVKQVDKSKVAVQKSLEETQKLFDSLMQEYFG